MSKLFFDHLVEIKKIKFHIDKLSESHEEKIDIWNLVDEYVNRKIISLILTELEDEFHDEFLNMFLEKPYDENIVKYLNERLRMPIEGIVENNLSSVNFDLMEILEIEAPDEVEKKGKRKPLHKKVPDKNF